MSATTDRLLVATTSLGKLSEIRALLSDVPVALSGLQDHRPIPEPEETGATFEENARLKAIYYGAHVGDLTVAEDSGLVIDALDGEPGIHSARFLGPDASYPERFDEIERRLAERPVRGRAARFVCALAVVSPNRVLFETMATIEGSIAETPRGREGFGYDPVFFYPPYGCTLAEVTLEQKLRVAHRGTAFRALAEWLKQRAARGPLGSSRGSSQPPTRGR